MANDLIVGNGRVLTFTVKHGNGATPLAGEVTAVRLKIEDPTGTETNGVLTPVPATTNQWTGVVLWTMPGDWTARFESDGVETAQERTWRVRRSAMTSPN
jgi:hypothetical protein